jgi:DNA-formamidopyrimidine glycosylase
MTGTLLLDPDEPPRHRRVTFSFSGGRTLVFDDPRRFGTGELALGTPAREDFLARRLGVEPFSAGFTSAHLYALTRASRAPIKAFLLDQRKVAGVGNIYADEALYRARIHPLRPARQLKRGQVAALRDAVVAVLEAGIASKGASIDDFRHPDGVQGSFQDRFLIHLREGEPCLVCGRPVRKLRAAGRGTYVCAPAGAPGCSGGDAQVGQPAGAIRGGELLKAAQRLPVDDHLREGHHARLGDELGAAVRVLAEVDFLVGDAAAVQQGLCRPAVPARFGGEDSDSTHYFT